MSRAQTPADATPPVLLAERADGVLTLTLNRPHRRNAIDTALARALLDALRAADRDETLRAVVLAGSGPVFCAGADLGEFKGDAADPAAVDLRSNLFLDLQCIFEEIEVTVVCALHGAAVGAGASLAVAADVTIMGEGSRLSYPEIAHGMVPGLMISALQRRIGRKQAYGLLAFGEALDAPGALQAGVVNRVVPDTQVLDTATRCAQELAARDRIVLRETKRLFVELAEKPLADGLRTARLASQARQAGHRPR